MESKEEGEERIARSPFAPLKVVVGEEGERKGGREEGEICSVFLYFVVAGGHKGVGW